MIRKIRQDKGMTTCQLAAAVGVSHVAVINWESPAGKPLADKLPLIADALGVTIDALYGRDPMIPRNGG